MGAPMICESWRKICRKSSGNWQDPNQSCGDASTSRDYRSIRFEYCITYAKLNKRYAKRHNKSLSEIVTSYLDFLSRDKADIQEFDPEVLDVSDEIPIEKLLAPGDPKFEFLRDKYLHG